VSVVPLVVPDQPPSLCRSTDSAVLGEAKERQPIVDPRNEDGQVGENSIILIDTSRRKILQNMYNIFSVDHLF